MPLYASRVHRSVLSSPTSVSVKAFTVSYSGLNSSRIFTSTFFLSTFIRSADKALDTTLPFSTLRVIVPKPMLRQWLPEFIRQMLSLMCTAGLWSCEQITKSTPLSDLNRSSPWLSYCCPSPSPVPEWIATITASDFSCFLILSTVSWASGIRDSNSIPSQSRGESQFFMLGFVNPMIVIFSPCLSRVTNSGKYGFPLSVRIALAARKGTSIVLRSLS